MSADGNRRRTLVRELRERCGEEVHLKGRLTAARSNRGVSFLDLRDRSGEIQLVVKGKRTLPPVHSVVACSGVVVAEDRAPGGVEVSVRHLAVLAEPRGTLDFDPTLLPSPCREEGPGVEVLLDRRELSLRSPSHLAIVRVTSEVLSALGSFLRGRDFVEIKTPKIVLAGAEGGAGLFEVRYFERTAYLAQSPQLFKQTMASTPLERVFEVGPVFRAASHATDRHLDEFVGVDVEMAYPEDLGEVMELAVGLVATVASHVRASCVPELAELGASLPLVGARVPVLDLDRAKAIATDTPPSRANPAEDLTPEDERALCAWARREHGSDAVLVHSFPLRSRPFYTMPGVRRGQAESFELLLGGSNISSGGLRVHDPEMLESALERQGVDPDSLAPYLRVFRAGCPPHGGFSIGLEHLVQKLLGLPDVRLASLFPRDRTRLEP